MSEIKEPLSESMPSEAGIYDAPAIEEIVTSESFGRDVQYAGGTTDTETKGG